VEKLLTATQEYNGTTWTAGGNLVTYRRLAAGSGTQTQLYLQEVEIPTNVHLLNTMEQVGQQVEI
jgi:hypothetical protein